MSIKAVLHGRIRARMCSHVSHEESMPRSTRFYFGRFNVLVAYAENKRAVLLKGLRTDTIFESRNQRWGFFDIAEHGAAFGDVLLGYLVKFRSLDEAEVAELKTHSIGREPIENLIVAKSAFCLHIASGLIAFHPVPGYITVAVFRDTFARLFEAGLKNFFISAEIQMVEDRVEFFKALTRFERIRRVRISLHPSDPRNADLWARTDDRMKARNATIAFEELRNDRPGDSLVITDDDLQSKFYMAEDGYGHAEVAGDVNGRPSTITTDRNPVVAWVPSFQISPPGMIESLRERFADLLARIDGE